jgi:hypothetical protein
MPCPQPQPVVAQNPKLEHPKFFKGKSAAAVRHFICACQNYMVITPFMDPELEIRWALQLMWGVTEEWHDEMMDRYNLPQIPSCLLDWDEYIAKFYAQWVDPHEGEKARQHILTQQITQRTSVKVYNNLINQTLALTRMDGTNPVVVHSYKNGLKADIQAGAAIMLMVHLNVTFHKQQLLMIDIDECLQKLCPQQSTQPQFTTPLVIHFCAAPPVPASQAPTTTPSAPCNTTLASLAPCGQTPSGTGVV